MQKEKCKQRGKSENNQHFNKKDILNTGKGI